MALTSYRGLPYRMFGVYNLAVASFFKSMFTNFKLDPNDATEKPQTLQVFFGTPRAAFRWSMATFNSKIVMPMLNFWVADAPRRMELERPYASSRLMWSDSSYDAAANTIIMTPMPMVFEIGYSVNLWCNNLREADYMLHTIAERFPMSEGVTTWRPASADAKGNTASLNIRMKIDGAMNNATEIEGLEQSETRDQIKLEWTMPVLAQVPYAAWGVPVAGSLTFTDFVLGDDGEPIQTANFCAIGTRSLAVSGKALQLVRPF